MTHNPNKRSALTVEKTNGNRRTYKVTYLSYQLAGWLPPYAGVEWFTAQTAAPSLRQHGSDLLTYRFIWNWRWGVRGHSYPESQNDNQCQLDGRSHATGYKKDSSPDTLIIFLCLGHTVWDLWRLVCLSWLYRWRPPSVIRIVIYCKCCINMFANSFFFVNLLLAMVTECIWRHIF